MKTELLNTIIEKIEYFGGIAFRIASLLLAEILFIAVSGSLIFLAAYGLGNFEGITWYGYLIAFGFGLFGFGGMTWGLFAFTRMWIEELKDLRKGESFMFNA